MEEIKIKNIILYYLQKDYKERVNIIKKLIYHIENLYDNFIINNENKMEEIRKITFLINDINNIYNNVIIQLSKYSNKTVKEIIENEIIENEIKENKIKEKKMKETGENKLNIKLIINESKYKEMIKKEEDNMKTIIGGIDILRGYDIVEEYIPYCNKLIYFDIIDEKIRKISIENGLANIDDIIYIYKIQINDMNEYNKEIYNYLRDDFVPININIETNNKNEKEIINITILKETNKIIKKYELILENIYNVKIYSKKDNNDYNIIGYFKNDNINTINRTNKICNPYIYEKKKKMIDDINNININENFKEIYIKNITIGEIISIDNIKKIVIEKNKIYIKYNNNNIKYGNILNEFMQSNLKDKFEIIKYLLMGTKDMTNMAGLLFGMTKEMKGSQDNESKPTLISDIIYKKLNYEAQNKLVLTGTLIKEEIEKIESISIDDRDLKKQVITNINMPLNVKKIALEKIEEMKSGNSEYYKHQQYVKILVEYPWIGDKYEDMFSHFSGDFIKCKNFLDNLQNSLDNKIYGQSKCKDTIIELVAKWITNPNSMGKVIGLCGPPGVGKTLFAKTLGESIGIPFTQINIGGIDDGAILSGHSFTYTAAQPGIIVRKMISAGNPRCIMFFDEVDKTGSKHGVNEITNILIHVTDYNSNDKFNDKFLQEINFPLSKVLFIFSYNDRNKIDKILLDRIEEIDIPAYNINDKIKITKNHLIQELTKDIGISNDSITIDNEAIAYIVNSFTIEPGVRELKRKIEKILTKLNVDRIYGRKPFDKTQLFNKENQININIDLIDKYLEKSNFLVKKIHPNDEIGVINGLYATNIGIGGILPILVYKNYSNSSKFNIKITGSQKRVMKESITFATTIAMNLVNDIYLKLFLKNNPNGLHIHTPDGSTPKDGPSAGGAFTIAIISRILNKKIKHNIAITGEIEANNLITAIGGLEYKLSGAKKAGINLVFIPKENEIDYNKIIISDKSLINDNFKVLLVNHVTEILDYVLLEDEIINELYLKNITDITYEKTFDWTKYIEINKNSNESIIKI